MEVASTHKKTARWAAGLLAPDTPTLEGAEGLVRGAGMCNDSKLSLDTPASVKLRGDPDLKRSLERLSYAVENALQAASQHRDGGLPPRGPSRPLSRPRSRRSASASGRRSDQLRTTAAAATPGGLMSEFSSDLDVGRGPGGGRMEVKKPGSLRFLSRWQDDRDIAASLLQQHSSWLQGFRHQLSKVAKRNAQQPLKALGAADAALGGRSGGVKVDLGNQELLITVRTK